MADKHIWLEYVIREGVRRDRLPTKTKAWQITHDNAGLFSQNVGDYVVNHDTFKFIMSKEDFERTYVRSR